MGAKRVSTQKIVRLSARPAVELDVRNDLSQVDERFVLDRDDARALGQQLLDAAGRQKQKRTGA